LTKKKGKASSREKGAKEKTRGYDTPLKSAKKKKVEENLIDSFVKGNSKTIGTIKKKRKIKSPLKKEKKTTINKKEQIPKRGGFGKRGVIPQTKRKAVFFFFGGGGGTKKKKWGNKKKDFPRIWELLDPVRISREEVRKIMAKNPVETKKKTTLGKSKKSKKIKKSSQFVGGGGGVTQKRNQNLKS